MFVSAATSLIALCVYSFNVLVFLIFSIYYYIVFLKAKVAANRLSNKTFLCLHTVGLYEWKIITAHPILTIRFKNILRTFKAEIFKIFKNIQPQPEKFDFLIRKKLLAI